MMTNLSTQIKPPLKAKTEKRCFECGEPITDDNRSSFIEFDMIGEHPVCIRCSKARFGQLVLDY